MIVNDYKTRTHIKICDWCGSPDHDTHVHADAMFKELEYSVVIYEAFSSSDEWESFLDTYAGQIRYEAMIEKSIKELSNG